MRKKKKLRSKLEAKALAVMESTGDSAQFRYESTRIRYTVPAKDCKYSPDWSTKNRFHIEVKGVLNYATRHKMLLVKEQNPQDTFALVFGRAGNKLYRGSPTTYGDWAEANGFLWCDIKDFETTLTKWRKHYEQPPTIQKQPRRKRIPKQVCTGA